MKYDEYLAKKRLSRNGIKVTAAFIKLGAEQLVGIKLWGAIDYLVNHCNFVWTREIKKSR